MAPTLTSKKSVVLTTQVTRKDRLAETFRILVLPGGDFGPQETLGAPGALCRCHDLGVRAAEGIWWVFCHCTRHPRSDKCQRRAGSEAPRSMTKARAQVSHRPARTLHSTGSQQALEKNALQLRTLQAIPRHGGHAARKHPARGHRAPARSLCRGAQPRATCFPRPPRPPELNTRAPPSPCSRHH